MLQLLATAEGQGDHWQQIANAQVYADNSDRPFQHREAKEGSCHRDYHPFAMDVTEALEDAIAQSGHRYSKLSQSVHLNGGCN